jgi:hypothetical protein
MTQSPANPILRNASAVAIRGGRFAVAGDEPNRWQRFARAEQVTEPSRQFGSTTPSDDLFQNVISQLLAVFHARGCAPPLAKELALKVTGEVKTRVREVLRRPGLDPTRISGVIRFGMNLLQSVWGIEYGGELEYLRTYMYTLRRKIEKIPGNPEYIVREPGIGYRFRNPAGVARRLQGTGLPGAGYAVPQEAAPMSELGGAR